MYESLPNGWREAPLGELVQERNDRVGRSEEPVVLSSTKRYGLVPSHEYFSGRTIYSTDLSNYKRVSKEWFAYATNHLAEGSIGLQQDFDTACVSPIYTVFECGDSVDPAYLFRVLKSPALVAEYGLHEQASVDRRGAVRFRDFAKIFIRLPRSTVEQRQIVDILDALDAKITAATRELSKQNALSDAIGQAIIPVTPEPRQLEPGWDLVRLSEVIPSSDYGISSALVAEGDGIPTLRMNNLAGGRIRLDEIKVSVHPVPASLILRDRDVLFNRTNSLDHVGRTAMWRAELKEATFASYLVRLNTDTEKVLPEYLVRWLNRPAIQQRIRRVATPGVQQVNINPTNLKRTPIELPTAIGRQQEIVKVLEDSDKMADRLKAELAGLRMVKDGLIDDLLTGRVRVTGGGTERVGTG